MLNKFPTLFSLGPFQSDKPTTGSTQGSGAPKKQRPSLADSLKDISTALGTFDKSHGNRKSKSQRRGSDGDGFGDSIEQYDDSVDDYVDSIKDSVDDALRRREHHEAVEFRDAPYVEDVKAHAYAIAAAWKDIYGKRQEGSHINLPPLPDVPDIPALPSISSGPAEAPQAPQVPEGPHFISVTPSERVKRQEGPTAQGKDEPSNDEIDDLSSINIKAKTKAKSSKASASSSDEHDKKAGIDGKVSNNVEIAAQGKAAEDLSKALVAGVENFRQRQREQAPSKGQALPQQRATQPKASEIASAESAFVIDRVATADDHASDRHEGFQAARRQIYSPNDIPHSGQKMPATTPPSEAPAARRREISTSGDGSQTSSDDALSYTNKALAPGAPSVTKRQQLDEGEQLIGYYTEPLGPSAYTKSSDQPSRRNLIRREGLQHPSNTNTPLATVTPYVDSKRQQLDEDEQLTGYYTESLGPSAYTKGSDQPPRRQLIRRNSQHSSYTDEAFATAAPYVNNRRQELDEDEQLTGYYTESLGPSAYTKGSDVPPRRNLIPRKEIQHPVSASCGPLAPHESLQANLQLQSPVRENQHFTYTESAALLLIIFAITATLVTALLRLRARTAARCKAVVLSSGLNEKALDGDVHLEIQEPTVVASGHHSHAHS